MSSGTLIKLFLSKDGEEGNHEQQKIRKIDGPVTKESPAALEGNLWLSLAFT